MTFRISEMAVEGLDTLGCDTLVCTIFDEERPLQGLAGLIDWRMNGWLSRQIRAGIATSAPRELILTPGSRQFSVPRILCIGLGSKKDFSPDVFRSASLVGLRALVRLPANRVALELPGGERHQLGPRKALDMWLTSFHQSVMNLGVEMDMTLLGTGYEIEEWGDTLVRFEHQFGESAAGP